jgi:hypothetical protein
MQEGGGGGAALQESLITVQFASGIKLRKPAKPHPKDAPSSAA